MLFLLINMCLFDICLFIFIIYKGQLHCLFMLRRGVCVLFLVFIQCLALAVLCMPR